MRNISFKYIDECCRVCLIPVRNYLDDSYRYTFGGKEAQPELGLNWLDFHARSYMPDIVRTTTMDPMANKFVFLSPYSFLNNNPLNNIDPTGAITIHLTGAAAQDYFERVKNEINSKKDKKNKESPTIEPIQLAEVPLYGKAAKSKRINFSGAMPDYLKSGQPDTWETSYKRNLDNYNQEHGTAYTEGNQWNQWYYDNIYKPAYDDMISSMHSATHRAAELTMYIMPTPLVGLGALSKAPALYKSAMKSYKISKAFRITKPNALNKILPGFTDKISGSALRQGRAPMVDFLTHKPPLSPTNYHKLNKTSRWFVGGGGSAGALLY